MQIELSNLTIFDIEQVHCALLSIQDMGLNLVGTSSSNGTYEFPFHSVFTLCSPGLCARKGCNLVLDDRGQSEKKTMISMENLKL